MHIKTYFNIDNLERGNKSMLQPIEIGKKIILYRNNLKISQTDFAKLLGVSNQAVSK
jgi:DNA-binding XRE family transcriptional regulator